MKVDEVTGIVSNSEAYPKQKTIEGKTIVDTESFNYAPANYEEAHQCLDVLPASPDKKKGDATYLENQVKKTMKKCGRVLKNIITESGIVLRRIIKREK